jgi:diguanylate cyclase (GGDEF)-like protein
MRLTTITNWAYGATVSLALAAGATMLLASNAQEQERAAVTQRYALDQLTSRVSEEEGLLSARARQFAITGSASDLAAYERQKARWRPVDDRLRRARDAGADQDELVALKDAMTILDVLQDEQQAAIEARRRGDVNQAIGLVFSPQYAAELDRAAGFIDRFQYRLDQRAQARIESATQVARAWKMVSELVLGATAFLFLCVLYFVFRQRVLKPVVKLSDVVTRLAAQDYAVAPPKLEHIDEIGDMAQAIAIFRENGLERQRLEQERNADRNMRDLLGRMTQRLQACDTVDDLKEVIGCFVPQITPGYAGRLYLLDGARQVLIEACSWLDPIHSGPEFSPLSCWALRRGSPHRASGERLDVPCNHLQAEQGAEVDTLCLPLIAQRETYGLLYLEPTGENHAAAPPDVYLTILTENVALAVANLRLRDALRTMAMADPLTGLANRRQLDAVLGMELARSERTGGSVSCLMLDVDHFKTFNDRFGHDAGDAVLRAVGSALLQATRDRALAFRVGGEEFLVLMPDVSVEQAQTRAEEIRTKIKALTVQHNGKELGPVTVSLGLASTPEICPAEVLVQTADAALLRAKQAGRDRVVVGELRRGPHVAKRA